MSEPFYKWQGINTDNVSKVYILELADILLLPCPHRQGCRRVVLHCEL